MKYLFKAVLTLSCLCLHVRWTSSSKWYTSTQPRHDWTQQNSDTQDMQLYSGSNNQPILDYLEAIYDQWQLSPSQQENSDTIQGQAGGKDKLGYTPIRDGQNDDLLVDKRSVNYDRSPLLHRLYGGIISAKLRSRNRKLAKMYSESLQYFFNKLPSQKRAHTKYVPLLHRSPAHFSSRNTKSFISSNTVNSHVPILHQLVGKRSSPTFDQDTFHQYLNRLKQELAHDAPTVSKRALKGSLLHFIAGKGFAGSVVSRGPATNSQGGELNDPKTSGIRTFTSFNADMGR